MKVDYLFFGAHPDDVELSCAGTILKAKAQGKQIAIVDLTQGELGSRGSVEQRQKETALATQMMGVDARENLSLADGFFRNDAATLHKVIEQIRFFRPEFVFANACDDRHPDHPRASALVKEASFLSGLRHVHTVFQGQKQAEHRPVQLFFYIQDKFTLPHFVIDISDVFEQKLQIMQAYESQFFSAHYAARSTEPDTYISTQHFWETLKSKFRQFGQLIGAPYAEGYQSAKTVGLVSFDAFTRYPF